MFSESSTAVRMDADLLDEEFCLLPTPKPLGHFVVPIAGKGFVIVSRRAGRLGYFDGVDMALPFLRMLYRQRAKEGLDFRLYRYDRGLCCWEVALRFVELPAPVVRREVLCLV